MRVSSHSVRSVCGALALATAFLLLTPSVASAGGWDGYEITLNSKQTPSPADSGGYDARAKAWKGPASCMDLAGDDCGIAEFQAWNERLYIYDGLDASTVYARVRYYSSNGTTYEWMYDTSDADYWSAGYAVIELGADDDLAEGNHIDIRVCRGSGVSDCTGWAWGVT